MKTISIIGAGPAGLMTAVTILEQSVDQAFQIHIFEKNQSPGKKLLISGGGRCNITTGITDKKILETKYTRGWNFIKKAIGKFGPKKCYEWFEEHGIELKIEADNRVFPVSDDGSEVLEVFDRIFAKYRDRVVFHYGEGADFVISTELSTSVITTRDFAFVGKDFSTSFVTETDELRSKGQETEEGSVLESGKYQITTAKGSYTSDILVITTGGNAYSHTGSTGDGYAFARSLGHTITPLGPSLSSFLTRENWTHDLSGLAFESARVSPGFRHSEERRIQVSGTLDPSYRQDDGKYTLPLIGPLLLTHFGISGPLAFMYSSQIAWDDIGKDAPKIIHLSPLATMGLEDWESFLKGEFSKHPKKLITSILSEKLPRRFVDAFVTEFFSQIADTFVSSISRTDREQISDLLGNGIPMTLIGRRPGDEFVTAGGVNTDEIDPETMESKIQKNLYFAGEVLNVDGYTGGFSLQICWSSGYTAGKEISRLLK